MWLLVLVLGCGTPAATDGVVDVSTAGLDDPGGWETLAPRLGDARFVGFGESVHRSVGLSRAKAVGVAWAVEHADVRAIAFEEPWADMEPTDAALRACSDGVREVPQPPGTLVDAGTAELFAWLCSRAADGTPAPRVFGIDSQQPWHDVRILRDEVLPAAGVDPAEVLAGVERCHGAAHPSRAAYAAWAKANDYPEPTTEDHYACKEVVGRIVTALSDNPLPPELAARGRRAALGLSAFDTQNLAALANHDIARAYGVRDEAQAAILTELGSTLAPTGRIAVWAHNAHLARGEQRAGPGGHSYTNFAARTRDQGWFVIAVTGYDVKTGYGERFDPPTPADDSVEGRLHAMKADRLLVDPTRWGPDGEVALGGEPGVLRDRIDAILFVDRSEAADGTHWRP